MFNSKRLLDFILLVLFLLSLVLVSLGNDDPFAREAVCNETGYCPKSIHAKAWNQLGFNIGIGGIISLIFYCLLVRLPEIERRRRSKRRFERRYQIFKKDCISIFLSVVDNSYEMKQVETLLCQAEFKNYFQHKVSDSQDRWHVLMNKSDQGTLDEIILAMEVFRDEISFVLNNTDISQDEPFEFFKNFSSAIHSIKDTSPEYEPTKQFYSFLWSLFSGWNISTGYKQEDVVQKMIRSI
jgi:hypothetical protein